MATSCSSVQVTLRNALSSAGSLYNAGSLCWRAHSLSPSPTRACQGSLLRMQAMTTWISGFWTLAPPSRGPFCSAILQVHSRFTSTGVWLLVWLFLGGIVFYGLGVSQSLSLAHPLHQGFPALRSSHPGFGFVSLLSFLTVVGTLGTVGTSSRYVFFVFPNADLQQSVVHSLG